jgi:hypothetical protein
MLAEAEYSLIVFGQFGLGKTPTSWSGIPLLVIERVVSEQDQVTVLFVLTEALLLSPVYE